MKGFTFIELLIVVTILIIVGTSAALTYLDFYNRQSLDSSANELAQALRKVQSKAAAGVNNNRFGVVFYNTAGEYYYDLYELADGESYTPQTKTLSQCRDDLDCYILPSNLIFSQVKLSYKFMEFEKYTGNSNNGAGWVRISVEGTEPPVTPPPTCPLSDRNGVSISIGLSGQINRCQ